MKLPRVSSLLVLVAALAGCGDTATLPLAAGTGPRPQLPPPHKTLVPTVNIAPAKGWPAGDKPVAAPGLVVTAYATGLDHPRWLTVLPNGDVLVAETNAPPKPEDGKGVKGWLMKQCHEARRRGHAEREPDHAAARRRRRRQRRVAHRLPREPALAVRHGAGRQRLLRRQHGRRSSASRTSRARPASTPRRRRSPRCRAGRSTTTGPRTSSPATTARASTRPSARTATSARTAWRPRKAAPRSGRSTRASGQGRVFASGLRNPNGMAWGSDGTLWTVANERDELGSDLVPDYLTSVRDGAFYGWPYSYYGQHVDERVQPQRPELVAKAVPPDYALGPHTASLGLASSAGSTLPRAVQRRGHVRRPARLVEPQAATAATTSSSCRSRTAGRRASRSRC